nr:PREDICTED: E3 ubiquitin-protein ligase TRIM33 [Bemisia tabaci]
MENQVDFESEFPTAEVPIVKTENTRDASIEDTSDECQQIDQEQTPNECVEASPSATTPTTEQPSNPWVTTKCIFCQQILGSAEEPKLLDCLHSACNNCIEAKVRESQLASESDILCDKPNNFFKCPKCEISCFADNLTENHFLIENASVLPIENGASAEAAARLNDLKCTSCSDSESGALATSWCVECAEYICDSCVQAHLRLKITKEHTIKPKEEGDLGELILPKKCLPKSLFCSVHVQERLSLFCESCDRLTCRDCQLTEHRDHKYKFINEMAADTRETVSVLLSDVSYKRRLLKNAMKVIDDRQNLIAEKKKQLFQEITQMVLKLTQVINARGKNLILRLNEICESKQMTLNEKKADLEQLSVLTDHCIEFVTNALSHGSDMAFLFSKTNVINHLQRIKSRRADIPNPEIPVRINLVLDKIPELIKAVSSMGSIMVDGRVYPHPNTPSPGAIYPTPPPQQNQVVHQNMTAPGGSSSGSRSAPLLPPGSLPPYQQRTPPPSGRQQPTPPPPHRQPSPLHSLSQLHPQIPRNITLVQHGRNSQQVPPGHQMRMQHFNGENRLSQVTSSTHPNNAMMNDPNLKTLLGHNSNYPQQQQQSYAPRMPVNMYRIPNQNVAFQQPAVPVRYVPVQPNNYMNHHQQQQQQQQQQHHQQQQQQHHQQQQLQMMGMRHPGSYSHTAKQLVQRVQGSQSPQPSWHIPQTSNSGCKQPPNLVSMGSLPNDNSFKIQLKAPPSMKTSSSTPSATPAASGGSVTSSVPKTPSPVNTLSNDSSSLDKMMKVT